MPSKYRVTTDQGVFDVTVDDGADTKPAQASPERQSSIGALPVATAGAVVPMAARAAMEVATNPGVPKAASLAGQVVGGIEGAMHGGPMGAAGGVWTGGKAGWFTGKLAQRLAAPIASAMEAVKPYAQTLSTLGGAYASAARLPSNDFSVFLT